MGTEGGFFCAKQGNSSRPAFHGRDDLRSPLSCQCLNGSLRFPQTTGLRPDIGRTTWDAGSGLGAAMRHRSRVDLFFSIRTSALGDCRLSVCVQRTFAFRPAARFRDRTSALHWA